MVFGLQTEWDPSIQGFGCHPNALDRRRLDDLHGNWRVLQDRRYRLRLCVPGTQLSTASPVITEPRNLPRELRNCRTWAYRLKFSFGSADTYTATLTYGGGTIYFALKTEGVGGVSALSNIAFWPSRNVYLPLIVK